MTWSAQQSGVHPLGRRHDEGGVEARMLMVRVSGCRRVKRRHMYRKASRRTLRSTVVSGVVRCDTELRGS